MRNRPTTGLPLAATILALLTILAGTDTGAQTLNPTGAGGGGYMWSSAFHPTDPNRIVFGADVGGIYQTYDYGQSWVKWTGGLANKDAGRSFYIEDLIGLSWDGGHETGFFAATRGGIYFGDASGTDWVHLTPVDDVGDDYWYQESGKAAQLLPFSCFDYNENTQTLYAGAGYDRFNKSAFDLASFGKATVWSMNLSGAPTPSQFSPMSGTDTFGSARDITVQRVGSKTYFAVATAQGIYFRKQPSPFGWTQVHTATDCWSVHITQRGSLYAAFENGAVEVVSSVASSFDETDFVTVDRTSGDGPEPHTDNRVSERTNLFNLTVVDGDGDGDDILLLGGWPMSNLMHGGLYRCEVNGTEPIDPNLEWLHWVHKDLPWIPFTFRYYPLGGGVATDLEAGYPAFPELDMPVEPAVFAGDPDRIFIHTTGRAFVYDGPNDEWVQRYTIDLLGDQTVWKSRGWNELSTRDLAFFEDTGGTKQILAANADIGLMRSTGSVAYGYSLEYHNPVHNTINTQVDESYVRNTRYVRYRDNWNNQGEGAIFLGKSVENAKWPSKLFMWRESTGWTNITDAGEDKNDYISPTVEVRMVYEDFVFVDDTTIYLAYAMYLPDLTQDQGLPSRSDIIKQGVLRGTYTGSNWSWTEASNGDLMFLDHWWTRELMYNAPTNTVFLASRGYGGGDGGLYCLDLDDGYPAWERVWGEPSDSYRDFHSLAQSEDGQVMYAGTVGTAMGVGAVLKCVLGTGIDGSDPLDWSNITPANQNPFGFEIPFGRTSDFDPPGGAWSTEDAANHLTHINALAVSPYSNGVVFAGLYHAETLPQEGLWVYNYAGSGTWDEFPSTSDLDGMSVQSLAFPSEVSQDATARLVAGTNGQEMYIVTIPKPTGGGGCPYVYAFDGTDYREDNTILARVPNGRGGDAEANVVDRYVLQRPLSVSDGTLRLEIREFENERSYIDRLELVAVDHPAGTEVVVMDDGNLTVQREWVVPHAAQTKNGSDVLKRVVSRDAVSLEGRSGDTVDLVYRVPKTGLTGIVTSSGEKDPENPNPTVGGHPDSGIEVLLRDPARGHYVSVGVFVPREHTAPRALSIPATLLRNIEAGQEFSVRLQWHSDHSLDFAGLMTPVDAELTRHELAAPRVRHSARAADAATLESSDGRFVELAPGETLALEFDAPAPAGDGIRSYVLVAEGHYVHLDRSPEKLPTAFATYPNVPNPFNPSTTIRFDLPTQEHVSLRVYSVTGELVRTIVNEVMPGGRHAVEWDGRNNSGAPLSSGVYFYRVSTRLGTETRKMTLLK